MIEIKQARVTNISTHLTDDLLNKSIIVGIKVEDVTDEQLKRVGYKLPLNIGDSILPSVVGAVSRFNAQGKEVPLRDQPMETLYRDMEFTRSEWHGRDRVEVTGCVWIPYKRYPRAKISAPETHFNVIESPDGTRMIVSEYIDCIALNFDKIKHEVNLFLEIFGSCLILERGENPLVLPKVSKLYWSILPPGVYPWERIRDQIKASLDKQAPKALAAALNRFEKINTLKPDSTAVGNGGYKGYVVFGFSELKLFVLECQKPDNAIYIFGEEWQALSQLTKAEILDNKLHKQRVIHTENWFRDLQAALKI